MPRLRLRKAILGLIVLVILSLTYLHLNTWLQNSSYEQKQLIIVNENHLALSADDLNNLNFISRKPTDYVGDFFNDKQVTPETKYWFMKDGQLRPEAAPVDPNTSQRLARLWPEEADDDRIIDQLMFVPPASPNDKKLKKILLYTGLRDWRPIKAGRQSFVENRCPVDTCEVTADRNEADVADAILFNDHFTLGHQHGEKPRPWWQIWILYLLECPYHTHDVPHQNVINWTATYRHDSDIVTPYEKFVPYDKSKRIRLTPLKNYAENKTKKVAWFVSNCGAQNGRNAYAAQLGKHIEVDVYGTCGKLQCPRNDQKKCFSMLNTDYKFYLSFENSNCKDYITEKFFVNGLGNDVLPIVLGAPKEDYERVAPVNSFIHVEDFQSPKHLAEYLHMLDKNDTLYNEYFRWKGTGEFINTYFWCRVCALLHDQYPVKNYQDINKWWDGSGICTQQRWDGKPLLN
ncbi:hypothetical protein CHUAL_005000 [Chamberlinius hualienensis]